MIDAAIQIDTDLGDQAIHHARKFVTENVEEHLPNEKAWPVKRSQIYGLQQIVACEPLNLTDFAKSQRDKAEKRDPNGAACKFWKLIDSLCSGSRNPTWSLKKARDDALTDLDAFSKREQDRLRRNWVRDFWPLFFQRFCAEYLYLMASRTQENDHGDR